MNRIQTCTITAALVMAAASSTLLAKAGIPPRPEQIKFAELAFEPPMSEDYRHEITVDGATVPVYMAPSHEFPLVSISFSFKGGAYLEPADKVGLASMTGQMMRRGGNRHWHRGHHGMRGQRWQRQGRYHQNWRNNRAGRSDGQGRRWRQRFEENTGFNRGNGLRDWQSL